MTRACQAALAAFLFSSVAAAGSAAANDTTATLGTAGLQLTEASDIVMESEDLAISTREIRVRYSFRNVSAAPIETIVAFPLPAIDWRRLNESPIDKPASDGVNFVDFAVSVDGAEVVPRVEQRAFLDDRDVTDDVRRRGLPMTMFEPDYWELLMAVPEPDRRALEAEGLAFFEDEYESAYPQWLTRTSFYWSQTFPPDRPVVVEHSYKPVVGRFGIGDYVFRDGDEAAALQRKQFCIEGASEAALRARLAGSTPEQPIYFLSERVQYILTTAGNWQGPVGRFRLSIDTENADAILATCMPGLAASGPSTFEFEASDYVPDRDLDLLIVQNVPPSWAQ